MLILLEPFLVILLLDTTCSSIILFHMFIHAFNSSKIPVHCSGTQDTLKKVICLNLSWDLFLLLCRFYMNLNIQNSSLHWSSTYHWQFSIGNLFHGSRSTNLKVTLILPAAIVSLCVLPNRFHSPNSFAKPPHWFHLVSFPTAAQNFLETGIHLLHCLLADLSSSWYIT